MQFIEFLFEAFSIMAIPILLGMLVAFIVVIFILVSIIKTIMRKIQKKPQSSAKPQYNTHQNTYTPQVNSISDKNEKTETKPIVKASEESIIITTKFIPTISKYSSQDNKGLSAEFLTILKEAERGDVEAQCECGRLYMNGYLVKEDTQEAIYWYNKAAQQGSVEGHFQLGEYFADDYYENDGKIRCFEEARQHLLIAAKENHKTSQNSLAMLYCHQYTQYCEEKGLQTKEQREADPVYLDYLKKYKYWSEMFLMYNGIFSKEYKKEEQNFIE